MALKKEIAKLGIGALPVKSDIKDFEQCKKVVEKAIKAFKKIDIVINNAGITSDQALFLMSTDMWEKVITTNLTGTFNMTKSAITLLLKQKEGCVINMSSVSGLVGLPGQTNYSASKAGIIGFSKALAKEAGPYNVRVNVVCPGYTRTDMLNGLRDDVKKNIINTIPLKRLGKPGGSGRSLCLSCVRQSPLYHR